MGSVGNRRTTLGIMPVGVQGTSQPQNIADQVPDDSNTPVTTNSTQFSNMSDSEMAQLVRDAKRAILPNHMSDKKDLTQQVVFQLGLNDKPQVLDRKSFDDFIRDNNIDKNEVLTRTINPSQYINQMGTNINLSADQIANMLKYSRFNYIGGKYYGQSYGAGTYFAANGYNAIGKDTGYGRGLNQTSISAVLNPNTAKVISLSQLRSLARSFENSHPQFTRAVGGYSSSNASIYALAMGYNVIADRSSGNSGGDYVNVIDRRAIVYLQ